MLDLISAGIAGIAGMTGKEIGLLIIGFAYICVVIYVIYLLYKYITKRSENFEVENDFEVEENFKVK
jgi:hypothetical protein